MTRRHLALVPVVAAVLSVLVACGGGKPSDPSKEDVPLRTEGCSAQNANSSAPVDDTDLNIVADQIHPKALADFADVYAGVEVVTEASRVRVYRKPSGPFDEWIKQTFAPKCVEITNAAHSAAELTTLLSKVEGDAGYWAERGINITATAAKQDGSGLVVGVEKDVVRAQQELTAKYGSAIPFFVEENEQA